MSTVTDDQTLRNIADNLRRLLAIHKLSQNGLARDIGESPTRINQYAQGNKMPGAGVLSRIAERFSVSTDEIIGLPPRAPRGRKKTA
jgi:transcriptional regulator with XRE-family HTH domain